MYIGEHINANALPSEGGWRIRRIVALTTETVHEYAENKIVYLILSSSDVTNFIVNISTSTCKEEMPVLPNGKLVVEIQSKYKDKVLEYRWFTADEVVTLMNKESSIIDALLSLFT